MPWGPNSPDETRGFIARAMATRKERPRKNLELAVTLRDGGRLIGGAGIHVAGRNERKAWIGYCFHREVWGQGYGTETARALVGFGFTSLGLHRIYATCDAANRPSQRVPPKAGLQLEAQLPEDDYIRGRWRDSLVYGILEHEWEPARG
jgi:RimJ/RimL family protein N-acetyltransferase